MYVSSFYIRHPVCNSSVLRNIMLLIQQVVLKVENDENVTLSFTLFCCCICITALHIFAPAFRKFTFSYKIKVSL